MDCTVRGCLIDCQHRARTQTYPGPHSWCITRVNTVCMGALGNLCMKRKYLDNVSVHSECSGQSETRLQLVEYIYFEWSDLSQHSYHCNLKFWNCFEDFSQYITKFFFFPRKWDCNKWECLLNFIGRLLHTSGDNFIRLTCVLNTAISLK